MLRESESTLEERYRRWLEFIGEGHSEDKQQEFYAGFCESSVVPCKRVVAGHIWLVEEVTS